jgi:hypothetical protein
VFSPDVIKRERAASRSEPIVSLQHEWVETSLPIYAQKLYVYNPTMFLSFTICPLNMGAACFCEVSKITLQHTARTQKEDKH